MSLKIFHFIFILLSTALSLACANSAYQAYRAEANPTYLFWAVFSVVAGVALIVYSFWFMRKMRKIIL